MMNKRRIQSIVITVIVLLFAISAIGYIVLPDKMLSIVGIVSNAQMEFMARTLAAALLALIPGAWAVRHKIDSPLFRPTLIGLAGYMFLSSAVDLYAYLNAIVNTASIPSIIFRVLLGGAILWFMSP